MKILILLSALTLAAGQGRAERPITDEAVQRAEETWDRLPPDAKVRIMRLHQAMTQMPPEERRFIHDRLERFLQMPPEERAQLRKNAERWQSMSPEERQQAREKFRQRRQEFEEKWRREHPGQEPPPWPPRGNRQNPPKPSTNQPQENQP